VDVASGFAFGYDPTGRSVLFYNRSFDAEALDGKNTLNIQLLQNSENIPIHFFA